MGNATAGFNGDVEIKAGSKITTKGDGTEIGRVNSVTISISHNELDVTSLGNTAFDRIKGIEDVEFTVEGYVESSDAGQVILEDEFNDAGTIDVAVFPTGDSNGFRARCICFSNEQTAEKDSPNTFSASLMISDGNGSEKLS